MITLKPSKNGFIISLFLPMLIITARLSFSGAGGMDTHNDTYTAAASAYNTNSNINRGSLYLEKLNENDEEYPQKVHRIGTLHIPTPYLTFPIPSEHTYTSIST